MEVLFFVFWLVCGVFSYIWHIKDSKKIFGKVTKTDYFETIPLLFGGPLSFLLVGWLNSFAKDRGLVRSEEGQDN